MTAMLANPQPRQLELTPEQIELVKKTCMPENSTDDELKLFLYICAQKNLNPLLRQIYAMRQKRTGKLMFFIGIDGFRAEAERSRKYAGQKGPFWCGEDGVWKDVWLSPEPPLAAKIGILRKGFQEPLWAIATWTAYHQTHLDKNSNKYVLTGFWANGGPHMLAKCAEALGLRKAFPEGLGGLHVEEEEAAALRDPSQKVEVPAGHLDEVFKPQSLAPPPAVIPTMEPLPPIVGPPTEPVQAELVIPKAAKVVDTGKTKSGAVKVMWGHKWFYCFDDPELQGWLLKAKDKECIFTTAAEDSKWPLITGILQIGKRQFDGRAPFVSPDEPTGKEIEL